jgi:hypothetical protein
MKLHLAKQPAVQKFWAAETERSGNLSGNFWRIPTLGIPLLLLCVLMPLDMAFSQQERMVIDGSIRSDGTRFPPTTKIRILHQDSSIDRTVQFYDPQSYRFGVRLSSHDGFLENEKILFRVVVTAQDSFIARFVGEPLLFRGTIEPLAAPTTRFELFRNTLPTVYRSLRDTTINEGQLLRYRFVAVDRDGDTVRFAFGNAPPGATIDPKTGMFSWIPAFDQAGKYKIRFLLSDGYDTDGTRVAVVTVRNVNRPPRFSSDIPDTVTREGDTLRYKVQAIDPDRDRVLYRLLHGPAGLRMDSLDGTIEWIPSYEQAGNYLVRFLATDGSLSDTSTLGRITVLNVDRPPAFVSMISDTTISEDQGFQYQCTAADPDGDSVWFSLKNGPEGLSLSPTGVLNWKPSFTQAGDYRIIVSARDQELSMDAVGKIHVLNTDRAPSPFDLRRPLDNDTVRLVLSTPIRFVWSRSIDPDVDDTLRYTLHVWGPKLDTLIHSQSDTTLPANIKPYLQPSSAYRWGVTVYDGVMNIHSVETFSFRTSEGITGSAELISEIPKNYYLEQSLPDPFNPMTTIRYALPERSYVKLTIFNMLGESLLVLVSGEKDAGVYDVTFDASDFTSGAYMFRLDAHPLAGNQSKDFVNTKKMFIVR